MNTYLGACRSLSPADIDEATVAAAAITYLEGYLWDPPEAKEAFRRAAAVAHRHGRRVSLTLSDSFCVDRFRGEFLELLRSGSVDILFANEAEVHSLYQTAEFRDGDRGAPPGLPDRGGDHGRRRRAGRHPRRGRGGRRRPRSRRWSTPPAPETSSPQGSSSASPERCRLPTARGSAPSPPAR